MNLINFTSDPAWEARFNEYLRSNRRAHDSLLSLASEGLLQDWLLEILYDYADPGLRKQKQLHHRKTALTALKELDRTLKVLGKASEVLESFSRNSSVPDWVRDNHFNLRRKLSADLNGYREALVEIREELAKFVSEKGEGVSEEYLSGLVEAVISVTGQPHWGDLAYLIEGAYFGHNRRLHADHDTIRKRYNRFVRNFPRIHETWLGKDWECYFGLALD
jgi:hypothetical protein